MQKLKLADIRALNIEASAICNAHCPFCSRGQKVRPYGDHLISAADFKHLPESFVSGLRRISFGGNFGDLCCNPEFPAIAADIRRLNPGIILEGDTNGSFPIRRLVADTGGVVSKRGHGFFLWTGWQIPTGCTAAARTFTQRSETSRHSVAGGGIAPLEVHRLQAQRAPDTGGGNPGQGHRMHQIPCHTITGFQRPAAAAGNL